MEDRLTKSHNRWLRVEGEALLAGGWIVRDQFFATTHALDWRNFEGYSFSEATNTLNVGSYFLIWRDDLLVGNRLDVRNTFDVARRERSLVGTSPLVRSVVFAPSVLASASAMPAIQDRPVVLIS